MDTIKTDLSTIPLADIRSLPRRQAEILFLTSSIDGLLLSLADKSVFSVKIMRGVESIEQSFQILAGEGSAHLRDVAWSDPMSDLRKANANYQLFNPDLSLDRQAFLRFVVQEKIDRAHDTETAVCSLLLSDPASQSTLEEVEKVVKLLQAKYQEELTDLDQKHVDSVDGRVDMLSYDLSNVEWNVDVFTWEDSNIIHAALNGSLDRVPPVPNPSTKDTVNPFKQTGQDQSFSGYYYT